MVHRVVMILVVLVFLATVSAASKQENESSFYEKITVSNRSTCLNNCLRMLQLQVRDAQTTSRSRHADIDICQRTENAFKWMCMQMQGTAHPVIVQDMDRQRKRAWKMVSDTQDFLLTAYYMLLGEVCCDIKYRCIHVHWAKAKTKATWACTEQKLKLHLGVHWAKAKTKAAFGRTPKCMHWRGALSQTNMVIMSMMTAQAVPFLSLRRAVHHHTVRLVGALHLAPGSILPTHFDIQRNLAGVCAAALLFTHKWQCSAGMLNFFAPWHFTVCFSIALG